MMEEQRRAHRQDAQGNESPEYHSNQEATALDLPDAE